jgi:hypothetical protein
MSEVLTKKKLPLLKAVKDGIKKSIIINDEGNYLLKKENLSTGIILNSIILSIDIDINQVIEYFTTF